VPESVGFAAAFSPEQILYSASLSSLDTVVHSLVEHEYANSPRVKPCSLRFEHKHDRSPASQGNPETKKSKQGLAQEGISCCNFCCRVCRRRALLLSAVGAILAQSESLYRPLWKEIDTEENYEHSVVKGANIITEPAVRRIELNCKRVRNKRNRRKKNS
jgi:hypothetical protein